MTEEKKLTVAKKPATEKKAPVKKVTADKTVSLKKAPSLKADAKPIARKVAAPIAKLSNATYATGKRKDSVARVYLAPGKGNIIVNEIEMTSYFKRPVLQMILRQPFGITKREGTYDVRVIVAGGGLSGQAGAVKHGISKALTLAEPDTRKALKMAGFLTRDSRVVERKHYGFRKARRSTQFSKR